MKRLSIIRKKIEKLILNKNWKMIAAGEVKLELAFFTDFGSFTTSSMQNQYPWLRRKPIFQPLGDRLLLNRLLMALMYKLTHHS